MKAEIVNRVGTKELVVTDQIHSLQDVVEFKQMLQLVCSDKNISVSIIFENALIVPSSVIGALLQKKEIDMIKLTVVTRQKELFESLSRLGLAEVLNIKA